MSTSRDIFPQPSDPLKEANTIEEVEAVISDADHAEDDEAIASPEFSDDTLALKFTQRYGADFRYTAKWGRWSIWTGTVWKDDSTLAVFDLARQICRSESVLCPNERTASRVTSAPTVAAVERLARSDRRHAAAVEQWDADPWVLNTPGGIVDLRTGQLRPARREDYCSKVTAVAPGGQCPRWQKFLREITENSSEMISFLQRMSGYALTGSTQEHALFFLYGTGGNGKSKFLEALTGILNSYAKTASIETFIASGNEHHPTDLAGLNGARLVTAIETEDGSRWAESKLKALTGGDPIAARFMRQDFFEFIPQFKLVIAGNRKPGLRTVDEAIRRRFNLLPFKVTIPIAQRDPELSDKLREEWSGILQWMIDGCLAWQLEGLHVPKTVSDATADYLAGEDVFRQWIDENCKTGPNFFSPFKELFENWKVWAEVRGEFIGKQRAFTENLESRGFRKDRTEHQRGFRGIRLKHPLTEMTDETHITVTRARTQRTNADDLSGLSAEANERRYRV
jgi:putative DNA primase/helicase